jgi:hypothetical protein
MRSHPWEHARQAFYSGTTGTVRPPARMRLVNPAARFVVGRGRICGCDEGPVHAEPRRPGSAAVRQASTRRVRRAASSSHARLARPFRPEGRCPPLGAAPGGDHRAHRRRRGLPAGPDEAACGGVDRSRLRARGGTGGSGNGRRGHIHGCGPSHPSRSVPAALGGRPPPPNGRPNACAGRRAADIARLTSRAKALTDGDYAPRGPGSVRAPRASLSQPLPRRCPSRRPGAQRFLNADAFFRPGTE